jgi:hypothetical protein
VLECDEFKEVKANTGRVLVDEGLTVGGSSGGAASDLNTDESRKR